MRYAARARVLGSRVYTLSQQFASPTSLRRALVPSSSAAVFGLRKELIRSFRLSEPTERNIGAYTDTHFETQTKTGIRRAQRSWLCRFSATAVKGNGSRAGVLKLILYSKPDCHLCHGLKEKIDLALNKAQFMPSELSDAEVEVRDITTNPRWEKLYGMVIPVLTVVAPGSDDEILKEANPLVKVRRVPPRSNSDKVAKHILAAVSGDEDILE